jgi:hypothetical protein
MGLLPSRSLRGFSVTRRLAGRLVDIAARLAEVCGEAGVDPAVLSDGGGGPAGGGGNGA